MRQLTLDDVVIVRGLAGRFRSVSRQDLAG
jgi:hypothetical protein